MAFSSSAPDLAGCGAAAGAAARDKRGAHSRQAAKSTAAAGAWHRSACEGIQFCHKQAHGNVRLHRLVSTLLMKNECSGSEGFMLDPCWQCWSTALFRRHPYLAVLPHRRQSRSEASVWPRYLFALLWSTQSSVRSWVQSPTHNLATCTSRLANHVWTVHSLFDRSISV